MPALQAIFVSPYVVISTLEPQLTHPLLSISRVNPATPVLFVRFLTNHGNLLFRNCGRKLSGAHACRNLFQVLRQRESTPTMAMGIAHKIRVVLTQSLGEGSEKLRFGLTQLRSMGCDNLLVFSSGRLFLFQFLFDEFSDAFFLFFRWIWVTLISITVENSPNQIIRPSRNFT